MIFKNISKTKLSLALISLVITFFVWQQGLRDSLSRPSVSFDISQREQEIAELAIPSIPIKLKKFLITNDPVDEINNALSEVSFNELTERNKLIRIISSESNAFKIDKNIPKEFSKIINDFPDSKWKIKRVKSNIPNKEILRIKVSGRKIFNGELHILDSDFDYVFSVLNGKIDEGTMKNLFTTIRNDDKKIDISFKIPDKVLTGSKYDIDIILNKPLEEVIIAGAIKSHQVNSFFEQEILLEPLASGGIFKITRAPSKPGIQIWSGIIAHPEGMITFTKSIDVVDEI